MLNKQQSEIARLLAKGTSSEEIEKVVSLEKVNKWIQNPEFIQEVQNVRALSYFQGYSLAAKAFESAIAKLTEIIENPESSNKDVISAASSLVSLNNVAYNNELQNKFDLVAYQSLEENKELLRLLNEEKSE